MAAGMQWLDPRDQRFDWLNVADWEAKGDGLQPVRVAKTWRDQWPKKTARRAMSSAGMSVRLRTDSKKLVFRVAFIDVPDTPPATRHRGGNVHGRIFSRSTETASTLPAWRR